MTLPRFAKNWGPYGVPLQISTLCHQSLTKESLEKKRSVHSLQFVSSAKCYPLPTKKKHVAPAWEPSWWKRSFANPNYSDAFHMLLWLHVAMRVHGFKRLWASNGPSLSANGVLLSLCLFGKDHEIDSTGETQMGCSQSMMGMNVGSKVFNLDQSSFILHHSFKRNFADLTLLFVHF